MPFVFDTTLVCRALLQSESLHPSNRKADRPIPQSFVRGAEVSAKASAFFVAMMCVSDFKGLLLETLLFIVGVQINFTVIVIQTKRDELKPALPSKQISANSIAFGNIDVGLKTQA